MKLHRWTSCAMGLSVALSLSALTGAKAQDTSQVRIPVRKGTSTTSTTTRTDGSTRTVGGVTRRESGGDVATLTILRIDSLEVVSAEYKTRLDALEAANAAANTRNAALEARIGALADSLATARTELATSRTELAALKEELNATNMRLTEVDTRLQNLNQRFDRFRNRSLFGNSGFYVGLGTGANFTTGTFREIGYRSAPLLTIPIGWHKPGSMLGIRTEWSSSRLEGIQVGSFFNPDPTVLSGTGMVSLAFPMNSAKSNNFYVMGGGGFYHFRNFGANSSLAQRFTGSLDSDSETKWGFTGGAGLEIHILGATSLFVQSSLTNVAADVGTTESGGRNLRWMPVVVGFQLR